MKNNKKKLFVTTMLMFLFTFCIAPLITFAEDLDLSTANIDIEGVKFNYNPGDKPEAKAYKCDTGKRWKLMLVESIFQLSFGILMKQKIMSYHKIKK